VGQDPIPADAPDLGADTAPMDPVGPAEPAAPQEPPAGRSEPPRTVRIPAPVVEPTITEEIVGPRTAEQPAIPIGPTRAPIGGGSSGGRRPPPRRPVDDGRGGRIALLAAVAVLVLVLGGALYKLTEDSSDAETDNGTTTTLQPQQSTSSSTESTTTSSTTTSTSTTTTSTTAPLVPVTDVTGLPEADAKAALEADGFAVGNTTEEASDDVDAGLVIRTDPAAGTEADSGSTVDLVVSTGPTTITVPPVVGLDTGAATVAIESAGLTNSITSEPVDDPTQVGVVLDQSPAAETVVDRGTNVELTIGEAAAAASPSSP
jgi:serine/threonine-protein kinase